MRTIALVWNSGKFIIGNKNQFVMDLNIGDLQVNISF